MHTFSKSLILYTTSVDRSSLNLSLGLFKIEQKELRAWGPR